jgi:hypothetical protein
VTCTCESSPTLFNKYIKQQQRILLERRRNKFFPVGCIEKKKQVLYEEGKVGLLALRTLEQDGIY